MTNDAVVSVNEILRAVPPACMAVHSFVAMQQVLTVAFSWDGGPEENKFLLMAFEDAVLFHLPALLWEPVRWRDVSMEEARRLIPEANFDETEFTPPGGFRVLAIENRKKDAPGFYVASQSVRYEWVACDACELPI